MISYWWLCDVLIFYHKIQEFSSFDWFMVTLQIFNCHSISRSLLLEEKKGQRMRKFVTFVRNKITATYTQKTVWKERDEKQWIPNTSRIALSPFHRVVPSTINQYLIQFSQTFASICLFGFSLSSSSFFLSFRFIYIA